jgi:hypothetical protein
MPDSAPAIKIDRLLLELPGGSADYGKQVAALVAAGLAAAGTIPQAGDLPTLRVAVRADAPADPISLARRIVAETLRALAREP